MKTDRRKTRMIAMLVAAILVAALAQFGVTAALGAHHFWSVQVAYIGIAAGAVLLVLRYFIGGSNRTFIAIFGIGFLVAITITIYGKNEFVASFAENRLAGKGWYYGWIAITTTLFALLAEVIETALSMRQDQKDN